MAVFDPHAWAPILAGQLTRQDHLHRFLRIPIALFEWELFGELVDLHQWDDATAARVRAHGQMAAQWLALAPDLSLLVTRTYGEGVIR